MDKASTRSVISRAWARNGAHFITGEALVLACLLRTHGRGRDSEDMQEIRRIMNDPNLEPTR